MVGNDITKHIVEIDELEEQGDITQEDINRRISLKTDLQNIALTDDVRKWKTIMQI